MSSVGLLDEAMAAHGGLDRWARTRRVTLELHLSGHILALKCRSPLTRWLECTVDTQRVHAVLQPFPREGLLGVFDADHLRIQTATGRVVAERRIERDRDGRVPRHLVWRDLDLLYFLGYALWNYTVTPYVFTWTGFECHEGAAFREPHGSTWRTLHVRFPADVPTHCREQTFYFDDRGLLRRCDYTADVFGRIARGAHLCEDHLSFGGLIFPTHRVAYPRRAAGTPVRAMTVMEGWLEHAVVA
jgi:hypothetical protein